jgi:hypothetical protein
VSWSAFAIPLHACPSDVLEWVRELGGVQIPEELPEPQALPTVEQVLTGLRDAGCWGDAWYQITDENDVILPDRPAATDLYLGEVSITVDGEVQPSQHVRLDDRVAGLSFRKPGDGLRRAVTVLVALGGPQLVFDTFGEGAVVGPDVGDDALAPVWIW